MKPTFIDSLELLQQKHGEAVLLSSSELMQELYCINLAKGLTDTQREQLAALHDLGPTYDGDVISKRARDDLISLGAAVRVVVRGEDGFTACTMRGREVLSYRQAIDRMLKESDDE